MKTHQIILKALLLVFFFSSFSPQAQKQVEVEANMTVEATAEVYELARTWAKEFSKSHPGNEITVVPEGEAAVPQEKLIGKISSGTSGKSGWSITLCRKVLVPVVNSNFESDLNTTGISSHTLSDMLQSKKTLTTSEGKTIKLLLPAEQSGKSKLENCFDVSLKQHQHLTYVSEDKALDILKKEKNIIAFLPLKSVIHSDNHSLKQGVAFLPIDRNNNGHLDHMENFYGDVAAFSRGVWIGKYPKELCDNIFLTSTHKPESAKAEAFISFLLTNGQDNLSSQGYSTLAYSERSNQIQHLKEPYLVPESADSDEASWGLIILIIAGIIIATGILANLIFGFVRKETIELAEESYNTEAALDEDSINIPEGVYFDKSHTWTFLERNGLLRMGIDDFLQKVTGPVTKINLKQEGEKVMKGEAIATLIQNGKRLTVKAPVSGTIHSLNSHLALDAGLVNQSPFDEGWMYMISPENWRQEIPFLKLASEYHEWLKSEFSRLKDFLSYSVNINETQSHAVLQDGGTIRQYVLKDLSPQVWEDFQINFLDKK